MATHLNQKDKTKENVQHKKPKWKQLIPPVLWSLAGVALCILLVSAVQRNNQLKCKNFDIVIAGYKNEMFISEADVQALIEEDLGRKIKGCSIEQLDLRKLEKGLQKDSWINKAQLYVDNQQVLHVNVGERLPVARIFTVTNRSFYIDSAAVALPLSNLEIADVPVFTNVPDRAKIVTLADSLFWKGLSNLGSYIIKDSFLLLQVGQISITLERELELYPVIGNHIVRFGTLENYEGKFKLLSSFYKRVLAKAGLNKYSVLDLRYNKQVVAKLRNKDEVMPIEPQVTVQDNRLSDVPEELPQTAIASKETGIKKPLQKPMDVALKERGPGVPSQRQQVAVKKEPKPDKKKPEQQTAAKPNKDKPKEQLAKADSKKPVRQPGKINIAANNKPDKKTIRQLPKKTAGPELIEVDSRHKRTNEKESSAKAVMPKKST